MRRIAALVAATLAAAGLAEAGTISLFTEVTTTVEQGALAITIKVTNSGNEAATSVAPAVRFAGQESRLPGRASLPPGQSMEVSIELPFAQERPGQWPLQTVVDYADSNGYPFQALQVALVSGPGATPAQVAVIAMEADRIDASGSVRARLKSLSEAPHTVRPQFYLPRGLELAAAVPSLTLAPWADADLSVKVLNRAALPGSRYPVFVSLEYDDSGGHHAALGHAVVEIGSARAVSAWYAWAGAGALVLVWLALIGYRRRRRSPPATP